VPLFMDVHQSLPEGATAKDGAQAHAADVRPRTSTGSITSNCWVDEQGGKIFCLVEAPDAETAVRLYRDVHGLVPDHIPQGQKASGRRLLPGQLGREDVDRLDYRWLLQQLGRLGHQGGRHLTPQVGLPARVIGEGVEDAELRGAKADREPGEGCRFLLDQGQPALQEADHLGLLAGLGDQAHQ
jgi:Protein of unknown function (DUF4242)